MFFDGVNPFWVIIEDEAFIQQVELGRVRFGKGDKLTCVMKTFQTRDSSGNLAAERIVKKVIHHEIFRPPPQMLSFTSDALIYFSGRSHNHSFILTVLHKFPGWFLIRPEGPAPGFHTKQQ